jgi:hypothetical protein
VVAPATAKGAKTAPAIRPGAATDQDDARSDGGQVVEYPVNLAPDGAEVQTVPRADDLNSVD